MPDPIDELFAELGQKKEESKSEGLWGRIKNAYDSLDYDWLPAHDTAPEDYLANKGWTRTAQLVGMQRGFGRGIAESLVGGPLRTLGTVASAATMGAPALATKAPQAMRAVSGLARGLDAAQALRSGGEAVEDVRGGRYSEAAGDIVGAGLGALGAVTNPLKARTVAKPEPKVRGLDFERVPVNEPVPAVLPLDPRAKDVIRKSYGPQVAVARDKIALPESNIDLLKGKRVAPKTDALLERASREFDLIDVPANEKNMMQYRRDTEFRTKIQEQARAKGFKADYSPVEGTKYVQQAPTPRTVTRPVTVSDIKANLESRGVQASDRFVARIRQNPELQTKMGLNPETSMEGVPMPSNQVKGLLTEGTRETPLDGGIIKGELKLAPNDPPEVKLTKVAANEKVDPDVREAASFLGQKYKDGNFLTKITRGLFTSSEAELEKIGPRSSEIARLIKVASTDAPIRFNSYVNDVRKDIQALDDKTFEKVVDYLEGNIKDAPDNVVTIGNRMREVLNRTGEDMTRLGLLEKGKRENYWPRRYDNVDDSTLMERMRAQGMSEDEITKNLERVKEFRNPRLSAEFSRNDLNVPGYRKDKDVFVDHLRDVAKRTTNAELFGPKDIADPKSPISQMIARSEDPERVRDLVTRMIRGDAEGGDLGKQAARNAHNYATGSMLSQIVVSNLGGTLPVVIRSRVQDTLSALGTALKPEIPEMQFMENTNTFRKLSGGLAETFGDSNLFNKLFGIEKSQNYMNRVAGAAGNSYVKVLFDELKANPNNKVVRGQIEDLTLESADKLAKQSTLQQKQIERAMVRMADITQSVSEGRKLPYEWNRSGITRVPQIFMRTAFQTSKAIADEVKRNPTVAIPKLIAAGTVIGELVGDTKELINTGAQVGTNSIQQAMGITTEDKNFKDTYLGNIEVGEKNEQTRFSFPRKQVQAMFGDEAAKNDALVRAWGNLQQAFALGLPFDLAESFFTGDSPTFIVDEFDAFRRAGMDASKGEFRNLGREVLKRTPFIGRGAAREVNTVKQQKKEDKGVSSPNAMTVRGASW